MFAFSDNFISAARFDSDIYNDEFIINIRNKLTNIKIVDYNYPKYKNTYENYEDVYIKYYERMPYIFVNDSIYDYVIPNNVELLQYWNYTIQHYDDLYDFFDNYQSRFIECCPVQLKCEVVEEITDEYYVLDKFSVKFDYENTKLFQKLFFYLLIKYI
jgi:hypothetical protein